MKVFYIGFIGNDRITTPRVEYKFMSVLRSFSEEGNSGGTTELGLVPIVSTVLGSGIFYSGELSHLADSRLASSQTLST